MNPYERAEEDANIYNRWHQENQYLLFLAAKPLVQFVSTFKNFPPRQRPQSYSAAQFTDLIWNLENAGKD